MIEDTVVEEIVELAAAVLGVKDEGRRTKNDEVSSWINRPLYP